MTEDLATPPTGGRLRRAGIVAAVGVGLAVGAAGIAAAGTSASPSPTGGTTAQSVPQDRPHDGRGPGGRHGGPSLGPRGAVHGEFVVPNGSGGFRTVQMQRGVVTAVSATSLTVKSADGYTKTYLVTKDTVVNAGRDGIATVTKDERVGILASVAGGTSTATAIRDVTKIEGEHKKWGPPPAAPGGAAPGSYEGGFDAAGA